MLLRHACLLLSALALSLAPCRGTADDPVALAAKQPARTDRHGDPLPPGALARLGTARLRHGHNVQAVACSPDGKILASAGWDHAVRLWDAATGKELRTLGDPAEATNPYAISRWLACVAFSPDGKLVAAGEHAGNWPSRTVHVWEAATGKRLFRLEEHQGGVTGVAFAPDGKTLASAGMDGTMRLWDVTAGRRLRVMQANGASLHGVAFSPDGKLLVSAAGDGIGYLWDAATGQQIRQLLGHLGGATAVAFAGDGKRVATAGRDGTVRLWDAGTGKQLRQVRAHAGLVRAVAFSPDGKAVASAGLDRAVRLWDAETGKPLGRMDGHQAEVTAVAFAPDGKTLASAAIDQTVRVWDTASGKELSARPGHHAVVCTVRFVDGGKTLVSTGRDRAVRWWDWRAGRQLRTSAAEPPLDRTGVASNPGGALLALTTPEGPIRLLDTASGMEVGRLSGHAAGAVCLAFAPDGKTAASVGADRTLRVWDVARRRELRRFPIDGATGVLFAPDGKLLVWSGGEMGHLWDVETGKVVRAFPLPSAIVRSFAFSPDGQLLACGDQRGRVHIRDLSTGKELPPLPGLAGYVHALAFSPDGRSLAAGGWGAVVVWEAATWGERCRFAQVRGDVFGLAFAPDGRSLASAGGDTTVLVWDLTAGELTGGPQAPLGDAELKTLWTDLAGAAGPASRAAWALAARPAQVVPYVRARVNPVEAPGGQRLARLVQDLDAERFAVREKAAVKLRELGELAVPALRKGLAGQPALEARRRLEKLLEDATSRPPQPDRLRASRAVEVLEQAGTPDARAVLRALAAGEPGARLTQEAGAALERLAGRAVGSP